jgi:hypothetical protein
MCDFSVLVNEEFVEEDLIQSPSNIRISAPIGVLPSVRDKTAPPEEFERSPSNVVRELAAQLADEKCRRREEVAALEAALAAAHGELLELRRRASARHVA